MERCVGLQTVVMLLCGFEKKYERNNEKNVRFKQIWVISNSGIYPNFICFIFFFVDKLFTLGIDSICIIFEYKYCACSCF